MLSQFNTALIRQRHHRTPGRAGWLAIALSGLLLSVVPACDDDPAEPGQDVVDDTVLDTTADADSDDTVDEPSETEPPSYRDIRATIEGELGSEVDLNRGDVERVLPEETTAGFRIFVTDNETATEDLVVSVVDGDPAVAVPDQVAELRNGLWNISLTVGPDMLLRVSSTDEAGNTALSEFALILPTQAEALVGDWETRFYTEDQFIPARWPATVGADGTWSEEMADTGDEHGGTYEVVDDELRIAERYYTDVDGPGDSDEDTIEWERRSAFYVDGLYFSDGPFDRSGSGNGIVGTWERTIDTYEPGDSTLELVETQTETIILGDDDTWSETWTGTQYDGGETPISRSWSGTYRIELNEDYTDAVGDFLVREITHIDGSPVTDEPDLFELHVVRLDRLLIQPRLRARE